MNGWVDSVYRAVVPRYSALTLSLGGVLLVLALLAMDDSEPFGDSELHPPRLLLMVAHAAGVKAAGICDGRRRDGPQLIRTDG